MEMGKMVRVSSMVSREVWRLHHRLSTQRNDLVVFTVGTFAVV